MQFSARPTFGDQKMGWHGWIGSRTDQISENYLEHQYFHPLILGTGYFLYQLGLHSDLFLSSLLKWLAPGILRQMVTQASIIQVEHPWLFQLAWQMADGRPIIYVAHNVENRLWGARSEKRMAPYPNLVKRPAEMERQAIQLASVVVAVSKIDADILVDDYGADPRKFYIIPNGVDLRVRRPATAEERFAARARLDLDRRPVLLFIGSDHYPNREAAQYIRDVEAQLGPSLNVQFVIVGEAGRGMYNSQHLRVTGFVEDVTDYLMAADIALNPLTSGSGSSLKAVENLACGLPTITTETGFRGLDIVPERDALVGTLDQFPDLINQLVSNPALQDRLARAGRQLVERKYGWGNLGQHMLAIYQGLPCGSV